MQVLGLAYINDLPVLVKVLVYARTLRYTPKQ